MVANFATMESSPSSPQRGLQVALGCFVFLGLLFVCETPRFLESKGRSEEAMQVLRRLRGGEERNVVVVFFVFVCSDVTLEVSIKGCLIKWVITQYIPFIIGL